MKLVVTGNDCEGRSVFTHGDQSLRSISFPKGGGFEELWVTRGESPLSDAEALIESVPFYPDAGDSRFRVVELMPDYLADLEANSESASERGAQAEVLEADAPGMHRTATIDFVVILSGEVELELDGGAKKVLAPGDCVVQRATRHRWSPRGDHPVVMAVVMLGVEAETS